MNSIVPSATSSTKKKLLKEDGRTFGMHICIYDPEPRLRKLAKDEGSVKYRDIVS